MRSLILISILLGACSPYAPDLGVNPFLCGAADPKCPDGYECKDDGSSRMVCVQTGGAIVDASMTGGFKCADDSNIETLGKNDTIATAYQTPVATQRMDITFAGLAICPEGDKDVYAITTTAAMQNIEVDVSWDSGMPLSVSILGSGGASIASGMSSGERSLKAYVAKVPVGQYFAQVFASATTKNNYKMTIVVTN